MGFDRRTFVRTLGAGLTVGALGGTAAARGNENGNGTADRNGRIDRLLSTGSSVPGNLGFDADGNLYVGITGGSVCRAHP